MFEIVRENGTKVQIDKKIKDAESPNFEEIEFIEFEENEYAEEINRLRQEIDNLKYEVQYEKNLNRNLLRINKERANADRKLKPKKQHTGYVVLSSVEKKDKYKSGKEYKTTGVWETVIQSPYSIEFTEEQARSQIFNELFPKGKEWIIGKIGITARYLVDLSKVMETYDITITNVAYATRLKANYKTRYWEYIVRHTLPLGIVPKEMLP